MNYTKGTWRLIASKDYPTVRIIGPKGQALASFGNQQRWMPMQEVVDNARLMSTASALFEALSAVYETIPASEIGEPLYEKIMAALRKATGTL